MGTVKLLLNLRDEKKSLPALSPRLGDFVRTNSEALLGSVARKSDINYSEGISISSIYNYDAITRVEPVRYPDGSSLMRYLAAPLIDTDVSVPMRILRFFGWALTHPLDFLKALDSPWLGAQCDDHSRDAARRQPHALPHGTQPFYALPPRYGNRARTRFRDPCAS